MPEFIYKNKLYYNPVEFAMDRIGGTWKMPILWRLKDRVMRYSELKKDIPYITHKMLTSQLRQLEEEGFIHREVYPVVPPKVEYSITPRGERAIAVVEAIRNYGITLMREFGVEVEMTDEHSVITNNPDKLGEERESG
ncbi:MAG TPA: helix-turn-helix domain-containing protein [Flavilitoribacter sp.]|nr:helix-turn-helix domain-containing protein [Flavilitoribacter sp.]HMQ90446.1 helix-turn-helix domain-containing protein [Flavilitoribacter sp.]